MRVLVAPDSFKGSASAVQVAGWIRQGWLDARPEDTVVVLPLADGGEGTIDAIRGATTESSIQQATVDGPGGLGPAPWLLLQDGTAVVELAACCGLPMWPAPDPLGAHTYALGQVLRAAAATPEVRRLVVALGGSASTDGGSGALQALGARITSADGRPLPLGGGALEHVAAVDLTPLVAPPSGGVDLLVDVDAPLLGPHGAAAQFGPQKGAAPADVQLLDQALARFADVIGADGASAGAGAAGGTAYGLSTAWGARLQPGSSTVADLVGFGDAVERADLVITGEGCLDEQSLRGKVVGYVAEQAGNAGKDVWACVGRADARPTALARICELVELADSPAGALAQPQVWLRQAGRQLAGAVQ
ncbi:glycerate kinase [Leekyejoonella antrihumi]|uniref:Glycerate kinase n=1 Tax=Leekyejoonella antrihumi TaxID=1660198 RepID=A0A563DVW4_9MICO|nr:glycerate kinase [Leekyejoonella antrihumi]TWP34121.1 glycerate kinase [Leekyejoonella antrihumi]